MLIDGAKLMQLVIDKRFRDGDEIIAQVTKGQEYVYSAYYSNFVQKKTNNQLTVQEYVFWTFYIPEKKREI